LVAPDDVVALAAKFLEILPDSPRMISLSKRNWEISANYSEDVLHARRSEFFRVLRTGTESWLRSARGSPPDRAWPQSTAEYTLKRFLCCANLLPFEQWSAQKSAIRSGSRRSILRAVRPEMQPPHHDHTGK
jgi:hypothetical protein